MCSHKILSWRISNGRKHTGIRCWHLRFLQWMVHKWMDPENASQYQWLYVFALWITNCPFIGTIWFENSVCYVKSSANQIQEFNTTYSTLNNSVFNTIWPKVCGLLTPIHGFPWMVRCTQDSCVFHLHCSHMILHWNWQSTVSN